MQFAYRHQLQQEEEEEEEQDQAQGAPEFPPLLVFGQAAGGSDAEHEKTLQAYVGRRRPLSSQAPLFDMCNLERALAVAERSTQVTTDILNFDRLHSRFATTAQCSFICWILCRSGILA